MESKRVFYAGVVSNQEIAPHIMKIVLSVGEEAAKARPGQFINIYPKSERLILPRPISICDADTAARTLTLIYDIVGAGTEELSRAVEGDRIRITSPLGNGFRIPDPDSRVILTGGGIGIAPMYFAARYMAETHHKVTAVLGFRKDTFMTKEFRELGCRVLVTTDKPAEDAFLGNVVDCMTINAINADCYMACGPRPMLEAVSKYVVTADEKADIQVSMEERMGCGYGACVCCVTDVKAEGPDGTESTERLKVCKDGPVFDGRKVVW